VTQPVVRAGGVDDVPALTELYNHFVVSSAHTFDTEPVTEEERLGWLDQYAATGRHRLLVAVDGPSLLGYATSSTFRSRSAYAPSVETSVYCAPEHTGRGVGSLLYARLLEELAAEDVHRAYAGVALPNDASVALHQRFGYRHVGTYTEVGRKFGRWWDVAWYERAMGATEGTMDSTTPG